MFALGAEVATAAALEVSRAHSIDPWEVVLRHSRGDWGEINGKDQRSNKLALVKGGRLFSSYILNPDVVLWVITQWDRSYTTLLRPEDY